MAKVFHEIKVRINAVGLGSVEIDGVDISKNVTGITVVAQPGKTNKITIDLLGDVDLVAEGCDIVDEDNPLGDEDHFGGLEGVL